MSSIIVTFSLWKEFKICRTSTNGYLWKNTVTVEADPHLCRITGLVTASPNVTLLLYLGLPYFRIFRNTQWPTSLPHHWSCLPGSPQSRRCSARHTQCHVYKPPAGHNRQIFSQHVLKFLSSWQNTSFLLAARLLLPIGVSKTLPKRKSISVLSLVLAPLKNTQAKFVE